MEIQSKRAKVIMLPTEQYEHNRILKGNKEGRLIIDKCENLSKQLRGLWTPQHIYITTDEEIREGDVAYNKNTNSIYRVGKFTSKAGHEGHSIVPLKSDVKEGEFYTYIGEHYSQYSKKIIATTNKSLNLPQPSKAFIEKYCKLGGIDEVEIEYEKLVKAYIPFSNAVNYILKVDSHNTITIHPIKYSWNREEVDKEVIDFATEYSGMSRDKVTSMYNKYKLNGKL